MEATFAVRKVPTLIDFQLKSEGIQNLLGWCKMYNTAHESIVFSQISFCC